MNIDDELMMSAAEEVVYSNVYYGKCLLTFWYGKFPRNAEGKVTGQPVRWNEGDPESEKLTMIDFLLDLCPGCSANYPVKMTWKKNDKDWQKIVLPSLKEAGAVGTHGTVDLRMVKDHWVKVQQVEGTRLRDRNDPDKGCWNTYKFLAVYPTEQECQKAMALDNGAEPEEPAAAAPKRGKAGKQDDQRRKAAIEFCRVTIGTCKGNPAAEIRKIMEGFIASNPNVNPYITVDDPEIMEMINEAAIPF